MAIKYLLAEDIETDVARYKPRLLGIANEIYILTTEALGTDWIQNKYGTYYANKLIQKKVDSGLTDDNGEIIWTYSNEYALEVDTESQYYDYMLQIHKDKLVDTLTGWDLT